MITGLYSASVETSVNARGHPSHRRGVPVYADMIKNVSNDQSELLGRKQGMFRPAVRD